MSSVSLWVVSCLLLGAELLYRQFYRCLVSLHLFFPLVTFLSPIEVASLLPCILLVCAYCVLRWTANDSANRNRHSSKFPGKLYVGELKESVATFNGRPIRAGMIQEIHKRDEVNTWIVAVLVEDPRRANFFLEPLST